MVEKDENEWFLQAEYDLETAEGNYKIGRYIYAIFMCHLAVEKALKAVYFKKHGQDPPRTHSLTYLIKKSEIQTPENLYSFIAMLSAVSVPTRYPDQLVEMRKVYGKGKANDFISKSREVLQWLKEKL